MVLKTKEIFLDIFFPKFCLNCKQEGDYICKKCSNFISENFLICPVCHRGSFFGKTHDFCKTKTCLDGLISIWDYDGVIKEAVKNIKYRGFFDIINELLHRAFYLMSANQTKRFDYFLNFLTKEELSISYVPMFPKREKDRGFNQARIISRNIGAVLGRDVLSLLKKTKNTKRQVFLGKKARIKNVQNSFLAEGIFPDAKNIVLVDDVFTSGATLAECCHVLKKSGVENIWGFTLARTVD